MALADNFKETIRRFLVNRSLAYRRVFSVESRDVQAVLADLARFCRANETTFHPDERVHCTLTGRHEVWLRIADHLRMTPDELYKRYAQKNPGE